MEVAGAYLGRTHDSAVFAYFRQHYAYSFPALRHLLCTTFVRRARSVPALERPTQSRMLRYRHRLRAIGRSLHRQAGLGTQPVICAAGCCTKS